MKKIIFLYIIYLLSLYNNEYDKFYTNRLNKDSN